MELHNETLHSVRDTDRGTTNPRGPANHRQPQRRDQRRAARDSHSEPVIAADPNHPERLLAATAVLLSIPAPRAAKPPTPPPTAAMSQ